MALDTFNPYLFVSSGEQSNKFLTPTYAGGIAKFQAQRAQSLTGLTVRIDPIQEGSGDPSPDNIRPISGRTGLTVTRCGKNLLPFPYRNGNMKVNGVTFTVNSDGSIAVTGTPTGTASFILLINTSNVPDLNGKTVTISGCPSDGSTSTYYLSGYRLSDGGETSVSDTGNSKTFVWSTGTYTDYNMAINIKVGTVIPSNGLTFYPQIELGSTATPYAPYQGTTYPVTWESIAGTVYGGKLDVVSGVLTVTDAQIASYAGETLPGEWISDRDVYAAGTTPTTGAQVVYKLATPQTYRLTGAEVRTIAGFNQIYSDAGPVIDIKF